MNKNIRLILYGFLIWLIPFISSFAFFTQEGGLSIDIFFFKSIMILVGSISAAILLVSYFKRIDASFLREGVLVGIIWFVISIVLDLLILIPMSGQPYEEYFLQTGLRYLIIPVMSILVGKSLADKNRS